MSSTKIEVEVLEDNTKEITSAIEQAISKSLEKIGLLATRYAKKECPVGTPESTGIPGYIGGTLRNSITHVVRGNTVYIGTDVEYAKYVELGTRYMTARPYLTPAATQHGSTYRSIVEKELKNA